MQEMLEIRVRCLGWEDPLGWEIATHSSILVWKIPQIEEPGGLQSMSSRRVGHNWARAHTHTHIHTHTHTYRVSLSSIGTSNCGQEFGSSSQQRQTSCPTEYRIPKHPLKNQMNQWMGTKERVDWINKPPPSQINRYYKRNIRHLHDRHNFGKKKKIQIPSIICYNFLRAGKGLSSFAPCSWTSDMI